MKYSMAVQFLLVCAFILFTRHILLLQHTALKKASSANEHEYRSYQDAAKRLESNVAQRREAVK